MKVYRIEEYSHETGRGREIKFCANQEAVISYLTKDGKSHDKLCNEDGGNDISIYDGCVLQIIPAYSELSEMLGCEQEKPRFVIISEIEVYGM